MADDFFGQDQKQTEEPEIQEEEKSTLKVGDKEYSQDELNELVNLGHIAKEVEEKYNTKIDRVYPEYTKTTQKIKELEGQIQNMQKQSTITGELDPKDLAEARKAAKKLGIVTIDDIKELGLLTEPDLTAKLEEEKQINTLLNECKELERDLNGSDGRPKFNTAKVLDYMKENQLRNPMFAYKEMNEKALDEWKTKQIAQQMRPGIYSERISTAGTKKPSEPKVTKDNLGQMVREALYGGLE